MNAAYLEAKGGSIVCPESKLFTSLLSEVREVMFNEEFRAILRRNLFALDSGDVALKMAWDIVNCLRERDLLNQRKTLPLAA
jgi:UDP-N-acetylglucosamine:LPS N-acetylglucosamine transferase